MFAFSSTLKFADVALYKAKKLGKKKSSEISERVVAK
jgi:hypothetical protein